ncbi:hypothetical protein F0562_022849 [Nyssa sinensis]|uniref:Phospholipase D C-terminal domain-containing protein n=1 Tax=Nyssa sinensis TaxID=561372 RepID=A0A5J5BIQ8_9ASTE|nr:hypothetical protein F0562_022849 [Nyssa sinensis]
MEGKQKFLHGTLEATIFHATPYRPPFPFSCIFVNGNPTYVTIKIDNKKNSNSDSCYGSNPAEFEPSWGKIIDHGEFQGLKNATFPQRSNCSVTLYQDAHHCSTFQPPFDVCGSPRKLWEDVYKAIEDAKHLIYIAGWSFNPKMVLVRDNQTDIPHARGVKLGELLKRKAEEGVAVRIMLWDDETSLPIIKNKGVMGTQ